MNKINFYDLMVINDSDLNTLEDFVLEELKEMKRSETGEVMSGLNLKIEGNKLKGSEGFGFSSGGKLLELKEDKEVALENENTESWLIYLIGGSLSLSLLLAEPPDPYKLPIMKNENVLVIGIITKGKLFPLNRDNESKNLLRSTVLLYAGTTPFKDFYTIKGFKALQEAHTKFLMFDAKPGLSAGQNEFLLSTEHLPSISVTSETSSDGEHSHSYNAREGMGGAGGWGGAWRGARADFTENGGAHEHSITLSYTNLDQEKINLVPKSVTLIPIMKVY